MSETSIDSFDSPDTALLHACEHANAPLAREALRRGANPNAVDQECSTAASIASYVGAADCLVALIASGASLTLRERKHFSPVYLAAMAGHEACLRILIEAGADVMDQDGEGESCALWAAKHGLSRALRMLAKAGAPMNVGAQNGDRPILVAARNGDMASLEALLAHGVGPGPDETCALSESALSAAAGQGQAHAVRRLLEAGADPAYMAYTSTLDDAAGSGNLECLMVILEALGHWKDGKHGTPLRSTRPLLNAALGAHADCVAALLDAGSPRHARAGLTSSDMFYIKRDDIDKAQIFVDCIMEANDLRQSIKHASKASPRKTL